MYDYRNPTSQRLFHSSYPTRLDLVNGFNNNRITSNNDNSSSQLL
jgi:hypothetical protein